MPEPIIEADFKLGSYRFRPKRTEHEAVQQVAMAIVQEKTLVIVNYLHELLNRRGPPVPGMEQVRFRPSEETFAGCVIGRASFA
jgi:hypothetical protein